MIAKQAPREREAAIRLLAAILRQNRPLDDAFETDAGLKTMEPRDRGYVRNLVATTIRRLGQIDTLIAACLEKPLAPKEAVVTDILRLGICQLLFLETPAHAAVDTSVRLTVAFDRPHMKKLVNAILRRIAREGPQLLDAHDPERLNTPDWLWRSWEAAYGAEMSRAIARHHLSVPPLDITLKRPAEASEWAERLEATVLPTGGLRRPAGGAVSGLPGFAEGAWWVQDAAATLPAGLLGDVTGKTVIDLCAAPGGKTAQLAAAGARVTAVERSAKRLGRLQDNLGRLGLEAETVVANAETWRPDEPADAILLDAPCSATGTIRRHPDVARLKTPEDVAKLTAAQGRLLVAALDMIKPGGLLVYCTCSLQPEEGEAQIAALLAGGAPVERIPVAPSEVPDLAEAITAQGDLRTLPSFWHDRGGLDGFFASRLRRT